MANETVKVLGMRAEVTVLVTGADGSQLVKQHVYSKSFSDGNGSEQVGAVWNDDSRLLNATNETLDLDGLTDFQGGSMSDNNGVKLLWIENLDTAAKMQIGGGDWAGTGMLLNDSTDIINILAGGFLLAVAPGSTAYTITASTGDGLKAASAVSTGNYKILAAFTNT